MPRARAGIVAGCRPAGRLMCAFTALAIWGAQALPEAWAIDPGPRKLGDYEYSCAFLAHMAVTFFDAKARGLPLSAALGVVEKEATKFEERVLLSGLVFSIYGDGRLTREKAGEKAYNACMSR